DELLAAPRDLGLPAAEHLDAVRDAPRCPVVSLLAQSVDVTSDVLAHSGSSPDAVAPRRSPRLKTGGRSARRWDCGGQGRHQSADVTRASVSPVPGVAARR